MATETKEPLPAHLHIAIPLKQREEAQLGWLGNALAQLPCHILLAIEAVGGCMASEYQVDQVLAAVAVLRYEAGLWLIHVLSSLPAQHVMQLSQVPLGENAHGP